MASSDKAKRASILIGTLDVEGFQMPDGSYRMSIASTAEAVGLARRNAFEFLQSKAIKSLLGEGYTGSIFEIEVESEASQLRGQTRISALPLDVVNAYWHWQSHRGNKQALKLCMALSLESLERRYDAAFSVQRSELEYNTRLHDRVSREEFDALAEAYAEPDLLQEHINRLEQQIRDMGGEPWQLPPYEP